MPALPRLDSDTSTFDAIAAVLSEAFKVDPTLISPDATLESLGLDSLALMEFVFAVEDRFDVRIPEDRLDPRQTGVTLSTLAGLIDDSLASRTTTAEATPADGDAATR